MDDHPQNKPNRVASNVPPAAVQRIAPGERAPDPQPGDFILTHNNSWTGRLIRFGEALRYRGAARKYARWNHAALVTDHAGNIIEALGQGVCTGALAKYDPTEYHYVTVSASVEDREEMTAFARHWVNAPYGRLAIVSIAITLLTGMKFSFGIDGQFVCSGLVAAAEERGAAIFDRDTAHISPADLAMFYGVEPPAPGTPKGEVPRG